MIKKMLVSKYDEDVKEPPYSTISIDKILVEKPEKDNLGEEFYESIRRECLKKGYRLKFYTSSSNPEFDYEVVVE